MSRYATALTAGIPATFVLLIAACTIPPQHQQKFACPDGYQFTIRYSGSNDPGDVAILEDATGRIKLPRAPAASGARYSNGATVFWSKGDAAQILQGDIVEHADCSTNLDQASSST
jgi:membrane-bound inhibitor of C-type lysozyme